ncbi:enzymatic polyprotein [Plakobranchus ocellatus]|uniref:Enzymatic polyprotein n=1 Tax=Plakobranchus ocellatus TaxID=259542 RepID=A0AAV4CJ36_9GAST|nr:enzymatic polyprotein [Plakobranchus ocellatus]
MNEYDHSLSVLPVRNEENRVFPGGRCETAKSRPFCCKTGWRITLVGSRFTSGAESRYAPIEGEALAVVDALDKARHFTLGCADLIIAVDHKPLLKIFGDRCLDDIPNPRLRNLKKKSLRYRFRVVHIPGLRHAAADAISHKPVGNPTTLPLPDDVASIDPVLGDSQLPVLPHPFLSTIPTYELSRPRSCLKMDQTPTEVIKSVTWDNGSGIGDIGIKPYPINRRSKASPSLR